MRLIILCLFVYVNCVLSKTNTKSLTESMGQEVIEIGSPLKDLPDDLEEEPSAEKDDDDTTTVSIQPATKKEVKKTTTADARRKMKDVEKIDAINRNQEEEEDRVEKELADIYKDSNDYKGESDEASTAKTESPGEKVALRSKVRDNFKFQPDSNNAKEIERFRTSVDEISCDKSVTRKLDQTTTKPGAASSNAVNLLLVVLCVFTPYCY